MAISTWWLFNTALGNSEGLLAAAVLWAIVAHLDGRHRAALALGTAAALLRPEVWPFLGLYGLWLWRDDPRQRRALVVAAVVVLLGWLGPDLLGTEGLTGASRAARGEPSLGSAALEDVPGLAVLADFVSLLTVPAAIAAPRRGRHGPAHRPPAGRRRGGLGRDRRDHGAGRLRGQPALPGRRRRDRVRGGGVGAARLPGSRRSRWSRPRR